MPVISGAVMSALETSQRAMDVIANNLANVQTKGFKASQVATSDLFYKNLVKVGNATNDTVRPVGVQIGTGTKLVGTYRILTEGQYRTTKSPLDIAIVGAGYFAIALPNGTIAYTKDGTFQRNGRTLQITTMNGDPLDGNIVIPDTVTQFDMDHITISNDGSLVAYDYGKNEVAREQLRLWNFPNENGLEAIGNNLFIPTDASGDAIEMTDLNNKFRQGEIELSNVSYVKEMMDMIDNQRAHEAILRLVKANDEKAKDLNNIRS